MRNALLVGAAATAISIAMLVLGFVAGSHQVGSRDGSGVASTSATASDSDADRAEIETIVRDYLLANPDLLMEMQAALETRQREDQRVAQQAAISESSEEIFGSEHDGVVGNPEGEVTIVEFFDYNCGFCKRALEDMDALVESEPELRFVLKEFPILGPESRDAHIVSMAFRSLAPDKYGEFHRRLLGSEGRADEASAIEVALSLGVDEASLREEMNNPEIEKAFARTYALANDLAITGTPSYVVGDEVVFGALGRDVLAEKIEVARTSCPDGNC